jgi:hypothetical protein
MISPEKKNSLKNPIMLPFLRQGKMQEGLTDDFNITGIYAFLSVFHEDSNR